jgi:hypothetical protein
MLNAVCTTSTVGLALSFTFADKSNKSTHENILLDRSIDVRRTIDANTFLKPTHNLQTKKQPRLHMKSSFSFHFSLLLYFAL